MAIFLLFVYFQCKLKIVGSCIPSQCKLKGHYTVRKLSTVCNRRGITSFHQFMLQVMLKGLNKNSGEATLPILFLLPLSMEVNTNRKEFDP